MYSDPAAGLDLWGRRLGCSQPGEPVSIDPTGAAKRTGRRCPDGSDVAAYWLEGMGHGWPGSLDFPADASALMREFFAGHPRVG